MISSLWECGDSSPLLRGQWPEKQTKAAMNRRTPKLLPLFLLLAFTSSAAADAPILPGYSDDAACRRQLRELGASPVAELKSLGRTLGGREIGLLRIGTGQMDQKPAVLVVGAVHAPHLVAGELALRVARGLVEGAKNDKEIGQLLERVTFYVVPRPTPDASEACFQKPYLERAGNARPVDDDHDGRTDEDGPEDVNGDGLVTMMRVEDPTGPWMAHPDDARVLVEAKRADDEQGRWRLYPEGRDRDGDEEYAEDGPGGVAFNRNFPFRYPYFEADAGPYPVSEVETKALADFAFSRPNIAMVFTFTPEDNLVEPWKPDAQAESQRIKTRVLTADAPYFEHFGSVYRKLHPAKDSPKAAPAKGSFSEWAYFHYGRWSLAARAWWIPKVDSPKDNPSKERPAAERRGADEVNALRWFAKEKIDGFVDWRPMAHPDLPGRKVEVGGFKPFLRLNPPAAELDRLGEEHLKFVVSLGGLLPRLELREVKAEPLAGGVWRVKIELANLGYLPSMSRMGQVARQVPPLQAQIELAPSVTLVTGSPRTELPVLAGNGGRAEHEWLLVARDKAAGPLKIRVWSPAVGSVETSVELKP